LPLVFARSSVEGRVSCPPLTAVGIRNGASDTEVILGDSDRCTVIEIGARLGAGHIGVLIQHALGIDPWTALLDTALGHQPDLFPTRSQYAAVRFLTSTRTGRLRAVSGLPQPGPTTPEVRLRANAGDTVHPAQANRGRIGHFIVTGPDPSSVEDRARQLLDDINIDIDATHGAERCITSRKS
jgi:biotin carboxylase